MVKKIRVEEEEDEEQYHVEVINKARVDGSGEWEYLVKWWGYDSEANSWEPEVNLAGCDRLLRSFWRHVGWDDKDYEEGDECVPSDEWIEKEKQFFRENFGRPPKVVRKKKKKKREELKVTKAPIGKALVKSKNAKGKAVMKKPVIEDSDSSYEDDTDEESASSSGSESSVPLREQAGPSNRGQKRAAAPITDSDDSDTPLRKAPRKSSLSVPKTNKGKEPARVRFSTPTSSEQTDLHSLFSAPPTPEVSNRRASDSAPQASSGLSVPNLGVPGKTSTAQSLAPPKPPVPSHRNREPKVKTLPLPVSGNTGSLTDTKRKIVERTGTTSAASIPLPTPTFRRGGLVGLSFKKKSDAQPQPSPTTSAPTADPRKNTKRQSIPGPQTSPTVTSGGAWGSAPSPTTTTGQQRPPPSPTSAAGKGPGPSSNTTTGGWGDVSPTTPTVGWGNTASSSTGGWGNTASSSTTTGGWGNTASNATGGWGNTASSSTTTGGWGNTVSPTTTPAWESQNTKPQQAARTADKRAPQPQPSKPREQKNQTEAEQFLASIMPDELAAPMNEPTGDEIDMIIAPPPPKVPIIKMPKLPQETVQAWEWSGDLHMETGPKGTSPAAKLCKVHLSEPTTPRPTGLRLSICFRSTLPAFTLEKFHDVSDIHLLLRACAPVQQFCKVSHKDTGDESVLKNLAGYMARLRQFTYARAVMDDEQVGLLLVFPSSSTEICGTLKVPSRFRASPIIAALVPWKLNVKQYQENEWQSAQGALKPDDGHIEAKLAESIEGLSKVATAKPQYARGLRIHQFSTAEYEFFKRTPRKYCIWNMPSDGTMKEPGFETKALVAVLNAWKAENAGYKADVRVVFVHVGALPSLQKLEALAMRRAKRPEMRFYTYGTHHTVHPDRWGVKEIFPLGGVATFTAKAILENPFEIYHLIEQMSQHPFWMCYVHPCAVAAVAKTSYPGTDVLSLLNKRDFFYARLLELIEEGKVSLLHVPPKSRSPRLAENDTSRTVNPGLDWVSWALGISSMDSAGILQECLRIFDKKHPNISDRDIRTVIEQEVLSDIVQMQLEPAIMDNYRRFVMIVETRNDQSLETSGVEVVQASKFDFKDEYFTAF